MIQTVPVISPGSSSVRYQLVDPGTGETVVKGLAERTGDSLGSAKHAYSDEVTAEKLPTPGHEIGIRGALRPFDTKGPALDETGTVAVGHRIVQGGKYFDGPTPVTNEVHDLIEQLCPTTFLHSPVHPEDIDVTRKLMPNVPYIAAFGTAFFRRLPDKTATYTFSTEVTERYAVRHYGAHGTSHRFVSQEIAEHLGRGDLEQIIVHLGNGTFVSAVFNGRPVDTSTGLAPLEGPMVGTRTGGIDPVVIFHLAHQGNLSIDEVNHIFDKESGMKGLTDGSDMRSVWAFIRDGSGPELQHKARVIIDIYVNRPPKCVGSYTAELGGLDVVNFTAEVDENDSGTYREFAEALVPFGVKIDVKKNGFHNSEPLVVSAPDSGVLLLVFPTNGELVIVRQTPSII